MTTSLMTQDEFEQAVHEEYMRGLHAVTERAKTMTPAKAIEDLSSFRHATAVVIDEFNLTNDAWENILGYLDHIIDACYTVPGAPPKPQEMGGHA